MALRKQNGEVGLSSSDEEYEAISGSSEHGYEASGPVKLGKRLD
jgi:hypothetical protein